MYRLFMDRVLLDAFFGLSPLLCRELVHRCRGDLSTMPDAMDALAQTVLAGDFVPWMLLRDGKPQDFSCLPIAQYGEAMLFERFPDFSALLDAFTPAAARPRTCVAGPRSCERP